MATEVDGDEFDLLLRQLNEAHFRQMSGLQQRIRHLEKQISNGGDAVPPTVANGDRVLVTNPAWLGEVQVDLDANSSPVIDGSIEKIDSTETIDVDKKDDGEIREGEIRHQHREYFKEHKEHTNALIYGIRNNDGLDHQRRLVQCVKDPRFDAFFVALIMINFVVMSIEAEYDGLKLGSEKFDSTALRGQLPSSGEAWDFMIYLFDGSRWFLGIMFAVELFMKILAYRIRFFKEMMNWLDTFCVTMWFASVCGVELGGQLQMARLFRLVRLLRLLKLVRQAQSFDSIFLMLTALKSSMMTLGWALVVFLILLSFFALIMCEGLGEFYFADEGQPLQHREDLYIYFGTFSRSLFTMFELTFANWAVVARLLAEHVHCVFMLFMVLYRLGLGFAVVGVINGIFMQETFKAAAMDDIIMVRLRTRADNANRDKMRRFFAAADESGDGKVSREELEDVLRDDDIKEWLKAMDFPAFETPEDVDELFDALDEGHDGFIVLDELLHKINRLKGTARNVDLVSLKREIHAINVALGFEAKRPGLPAARRNKLNFHPIRTLQVRRTGDIPDDIESLTI